MPRIVITQELPASAIDMLERAFGAELHLSYHRERVSPDHADLLKMIDDAQPDAIIGMLSDRFDRETLEQCPPSLQVIATYAVGTNNIDLSAATERGIVVANTPDVLTNATAEVTLALMLACARRVVEGDQLVRSDRFVGWSPLLHLGHDLYESTIGIVGAGRIGRRVAMTLKHGFNCRVLYASRTRSDAFEKCCDGEWLPLNDVLERADFVSLHCPLTPETYHLINIEALRRMKPGAFLINTARGPVVDEEALVLALTQGEIAGAGLDVFEDEPALKPGLASLRNVVLLPHIGSATRTTRETMGHMCAQAVIDVLQGRNPAHAVSG